MTDTGHSLARCSLQPSITLALSLSLGMSIELDADDFLFFRFMTARRMSDTSTVDQQYFESYNEFQVHELMLRDRPRVTAYHDAMMSSKHLFENKVRWRIAGKEERCEREIRFRSCSMWAPALVS